MSVHDRRVVVILVNRAAVLLDGNFEYLRHARRRFRNRHLLRSYGKCGNLSFRDRKNRRRVLITVFAEFVRKRTCIFKLLGHKRVAFAFHKEKIVVHVRIYGQLSSFDRNIQRLGDDLAARARHGQSQRYLTRFERNQYALAVLLFDPRRAAVFRGYTPCCGVSFAYSCAARKTDRSTEFGFRSATYRIVCSHGVDLRTVDCGELFELKRIETNRPCGRRCQVRTQRQCEVVFLFLRHCDPHRVGINSVFDDGRDLIACTENYVLLRRFRIPEIRLPTVR